MHRELEIRDECVFNVCVFVFSSGSPYYDNVRPLCYSDSDAVLLCFDISRPDTVDGSLKKVMASLLHFTDVVVFCAPLSQVYCSQFLHVSCFS